MAFDRKKDNFLIMDFVIGGHSNIEFHSLESSQKLKENIDKFSKY
jgi:glycosylphosphatidylinositol transamidase (GPIT) subunit GPI8